MCHGWAWTDSWAAASRWSDWKAQHYHYGERSAATGTRIFVLESIETIWMYVILQYVFDNIPDIHVERQNATHLRQLTVRDLDQDGGGVADQNFKNSY